MAVPFVFNLMSAAVFFVGIGMGIPMTYFAYRRSRNRDEALERIETTEATVTTSTVERRRDARQTDESTGPSRYVYRPVVKFRYEYNGETYESGNKSYNMPFGAVPSESHAEQTAQQYPVGEDVTVYFDPESPECAFLEVDETRQTAGALILGVMGAFTILMGLVGGLMFGLLTFVL